MILLCVVACATPVDDAPFDLVEISIAEEPLTVWFADESNERQQGLQDVADLPQGVDGMLFEFDLPVSASFNMRNTTMTLDIWWFDGEGALLGTAEMEPCLVDTCTSYRSPGPVRWALETIRDVYEFSPGSVLSTSESR